MPRLLDGVAVDADDAAVDDGIRYSEEALRLVRCRSDRAAGLKSCKRRVDGVRGAAPEDRLGVADGMCEGVRLGVWLGV
mgnify:FL=1